MNLDAGWRKKHQPFVLHGPLDCYFLLTVHCHGVLVAEQQTAIENNVYKLVFSNLDNRCLLCDNQLCHAPVLKATVGEVPPHQ